MMEGRRFKRQMATRDFVKFHENNEWIIRIPGLDGSY